MLRCLSWIVDAVQYWIIFARQEIVCIFANMNPSNATKAAEMDMATWEETQQLIPEHGSFGPLW